MAPSRHLPKITEFCGLITRKNTKWPPRSFPDGRENHQRHICLISRQVIHIYCLISYLVIFVYKCIYCYLTVNEGDLGRQGDLGRFSSHHKTFAITHFWITPLMFIFFQCYPEMLLVSLVQQKWQSDVFFWSKIFQEFPGLCEIAPKMHPCGMCEPEYHHCQQRSHHIEIMSLYRRNVTKSIPILGYGGHFLQNLEMSRAFVLHYSLAIHNTSPYNAFGSRWNKPHLSFFIVNARSRESSQVTRYLKSPTELENRPKSARDVTKERMI